MPGFHVRLRLLHLLEHLLVFLAGLHARHAEGDYLKPAQITPFIRQHVVERLRHLVCMAGQTAVPDAHVGYLCERGLKRGEKLGLELAVEPVTCERVGYVAADIGVEEYRVRYAVAVFAEAADGDINVDARALIHHAERDGGGRTVLVTYKLFGIEVIYALILRGFAAECEALADVLECGENSVTELAGEDGRLRRGVVYELAGFGAKLDYLAMRRDLSRVFSS